MYVRRMFDKTSPSLTMPTPILLALPSNPMAITIFSKCFYILQIANDKQTHMSIRLSKTVEVFKATQQL